MNAVVMDNVELGDESVVGALTLIKEGEKIPARSIVVGNPGKIVKQVSDEMIEWKTAGTRLYQALPKACVKSLKACIPLKKAPAKRNFPNINYKSLQKSKK
jgi:carbonic anhydrase/acetyltransferase-like protein (isoleucine patch superfamily)